MPVGVDVAASSQALSWQFNHRRKAFVSGGAAGLQTQLRASAALRSVRLRLPSASQISRAFPHFPGSATSSQYVGYAPLACYGGRPRLRGKWKRSGQPGRPRAQLLRTPHLRRRLPHRRGCRLPRPRLCWGPAGSSQAHTQDRCNRTAGQQHIPRRPPPSPGCRKV
jgi:hypothetical protein